MPKISLFQSEMWLMCLFSIVFLCHHILHVLYYTPLGEFPGATVTPAYLVY